MFHANCIIELLKHKWSTLRITFAFMACPSCKQPLQADHVYEVAEEVEKLTILRSELQVKAMKIARDQHLDKDPRLNDFIEDWKPEKQNDSQKSGKVHFLRILLISNNLALESVCTCDCIWLKV